ncbi:MAG: LysM peptidoglycan-binding domain-containing protein [Anaerolineales bacterium]|nr:LysM peptidoglycan-binding domain-containing protein [Anaerolineales bacterium]
MYPQRRRLHPASAILRLAGALVLLIVACVSPSRQAHAVSSSWDNCPYIHFVQKGETLGLIALFYGISVKEILDANELFAPYHLWEWQPLCIPRIAFQKLYPKASLSAHVYLNNISVWGTCFPSSAPYKIKIRAMSSTIWTFVGNLFVNPDGSFKAYFKLPESLSEENNFQICLKEQVKGYSACVTVSDRWVSGKWIKWNGDWVSIPER